MCPEARPKFQRSFFRFYSQAVHEFSPDTGWCLCYLAGERDCPMSEVCMAKPIASARRPQTSGEEIANSVSSGVGLLAVMAGIPLLIDSAIQRRNEFSLAGAIT